MNLCDPSKAESRNPHNPQLVTQGGGLGPLWVVEPPIHSTCLCCLLYLPGDTELLSQPALPCPTSEPCSLLPGDAHCHGQLSTTILAWGT